MSMKRLGVFLLACLVLLPVAAASAQEPARTPYLLAPKTRADALTAGPDGNVWFAAEQWESDKIFLGDVTGDGAVTEFEVPIKAPSVATIVAGAEGNLWFGEGDGVGRITTKGQVTSFPLPSGSSSPTAMTLGPEGDIWFTEAAASRVGRITPEGTISQFNLPSGRKPSGIAAGPEGSFWFTERAANEIGRITPLGAITEFPVPGPPAKLDSIALGPDGNLWFAEWNVPRVGKITPGGAVTQFPVPTRGGTEGIVPGPGGLLYFTSGAEIAAISPAGAISWPSCLGNLCGVAVNALAAGPDGRLWAAEGIAHCIGLCGGGTALSFAFDPGSVEPYSLPPLRLGIGPRLTRLHDGGTTLSLACGVASGCRGTVKLGRYLFADHQRYFQVLSQSPYELHGGESTRVSFEFSGKNAALLRRSRSTPLTAIADGEEGQRAKRGLVLSG
jgi:streptogramin lyase